MSKFVVCINPGKNHYLTRGKVYQVFEADQEYTKVANDYGRLIWYLKERFVPYLEHETEDELYV